MTQKVTIKSKQKFWLEFIISYDSLIDNREFKFTATTIFTQEESARGIRHSYVTSCTANTTTGMHMASLHAFGYYMIKTGMWLNLGELLKFMEMNPANHKYYKLGIWQITNICLFICTHSQRLTNLHKFTITHYYRGNSILGPY